MGQQPAVTHQHQLIAAGCLVHHMAGDQQSLPGRSQVVEETPQGPPQHRVQAHRRLIEDQQIRVGDQRAGQRDPGELASGEATCQFSPLAGEVHLVQHLADPVLRDPGQSGEVAKVLLHREVVIDTGRLGEVAHPTSQRRRPRRLAEHCHCSRSHHLYSDDGPQHGRLAGPRGAEQAGDQAGRDLQVQMVEDRAASPVHAQSLDGHRVLCGCGGAARCCSAPGGCRPGAGGA